MHVDVTGINAVIFMYTHRTTSEILHTVSALPGGSGLAISTIWTGKRVGLLPGMQRGLCKCHVSYTADRSPRNADGDPAPCQEW